LHEQQHVLIAGYTPKPIIVVELQISKASVIVDTIGVDEALAK
jgi:hypothetical protein